MVDILQTHSNSVDLNLLRVLVALAEGGSITRAGELLGMSQPAASRAVGRLREVCNDPLIVRTSQGNVLTPRARDLIPKARAALLTAGAVFEAVSFDASRSRRTFRVAATDYGALAALSPCMKRVLAEAPLVRVTVSPWSERTLRELEDGTLDLALYADDPLPPDFHTRELFRDTYSVLAPRSHALFRSKAVRGRRVTQVRALMHYPRAVVSYPSGRTTAIDDVIARLCPEASPPAVELPYFSAAPHVIAEAGLLLFVPTRVAARFAGLGSLGALALPRHIEGFAYRVIWHERAHADPGCRWLRATFVEASAAACASKPP